MAITHDDLSIKSKTTYICSNLALFLVIFSVICGIIAFILCLSAEGSKSEVTWLLKNSTGIENNQCKYSGSGRGALSCAVAALIILAIAMFSEHAYMLVAVTTPLPPSLAAWAEPEDPRLTPTMKDLTWQTCCLFVTIWVCFGLAEVLLMIGIGVESGHLRNWSTLHDTCHAVKPGVFAVSGVLSLFTVFLGIGLYVTALKTQKLQLQELNMHHSLPISMPAGTSTVYRSSQQPERNVEKIPASV